jgi:hypothetical protein
MVKIPKRLPLVLIKISKGRTSFPGITVNKLANSSNSPSSNSGDDCSWVFVSEKSFTEHHSVTVPNDNIEQDGIPRIIKGPSSVTAMDGGEIVLKWNILGNYYVTFSRITTRCYGDS